MNATTKNTIEIAKALGYRGLTVCSVEVHTPDGRTWEVAAVPAGRGRRGDGSRGRIAGAGGGYRLFEIDREGRNDPNEHDAVEADTWNAGDLIDYLDAVGQPKDTTSWDRESGTRPTA